MKKERKKYIRKRRRKKNPAKEKQTKKPTAPGVPNYKISNFKYNE